jgi:hypothetical protein
MVDPDSAILLLHIYCIYDSDMTHGGPRYPKGLLALRVSVILVTFISFSTLKVHTVAREVALAFSASAGVSFARKTKHVILVLAHGYGWEGVCRVGCCAIFSSSHGSAAECISPVALYNLVSHRKVLETV